MPCSAFAGTLINVVTKRSAWVVRNVRVDAPERFLGEICYGSTVGTTALNVWLVTRVFHHVVQLEVSAWARIEFSTTITDDVVTGYEIRISLISHDCVAAWLEENLPAVTFDPIDDLVQVSSRVLDGVDWVGQFTILTDHLLNASFMKSSN